MSPSQCVSPLSDTRYKRAHVGAIIIEGPGSGLDDSGPSQGDPGNKVKYIFLPLIRPDA